MDGKLSLVSYTLAAMAGICFISGLVILSSEGENQNWTDLKHSYQC